MELNNTAQYAIRILNYINMHTDEKRLLSARKLSEALDINYKFLTAIMTKLVKAGFLESIRGKDGGFHLIKDANEIMLMDIIKLFDDSFDRSACLLGIDNKCNPDKKCFLHDRWKEPKKEIYELFEKSSLEDVKAQGERF